MTIHTQSKLIITPQDTRSYNDSFKEWLPASARTKAAQGDVLAGQLVAIWESYRNGRDMATWRCFVVARRLFVQANGE